MPKAVSSSHPRSYWDQHVRQHRDSGLSKALYCRQHNLIYHQFIYWYPLLCNTSSSDAQSVEAPKFLPVTVQPQDPGADVLQLNLPGGMSITGINASSVNVVGRLIAQL